MNKMSKVDEVGGEFQRQDIFNIFNIFNHAKS